MGTNHPYHAHASFAYKEGVEHHMAAGHVKSITVLYTAEIELRPVVGGTIGMEHDPETGTPSGASRLEERWYLKSSYKSGKLNFLAIWHPNCSFFRLTRQFISDS